MAPTVGNYGLLRVVPEATLQAQQAAEAQAKAQAEDAARTPDIPSQLVGYIKGQFEIFRNHRNTAAGWSERLLQSLRTSMGQYDPAKLSEIRKFQGSEIYIRLSAQKCRAASSLLRDVYLGSDRPWGLKPPADPDVPEDVIQKIDTLLQSEQQMIAQTQGHPPNPSDVQTRRDALMESAREAAKEKAAKQARLSEDKIEELLDEGGFYEALSEFIVDLPKFPFACIKGPIVRVMPRVKWENGKPNVAYDPRLTWERVSPFDLWWTPGVADIRDADVIEKRQVRRSELNEMLDLPGYNKDEILAVLDEYGRGGLYDNWDTTDAERAVLESRENPAFNRSAMISMMEFNGQCQGRLLKEYDVDIGDDPEGELRDYFVQVWCIGSHIIKVQFSPSPRQRHPYFITSFEKVPGTPVGNSLIDMVADLQEAANATMRSLVNNLAISSGPQVVIADDLLSPDENGEELFAWKRWHTRSDPASPNNSRQPITFFQPLNNSQQLLEVLQKTFDMSDDVSAIPKYIGGQASGGAGRTASGLAMLMGNASKILQTVSANVDGALRELFLQLVDLILLTDESGMLTGEEELTVQGVNVAIQRETQRQRQNEFLQGTANPIDMKIIGVKGRGMVLRAVAQGVGIPGEIVPPDEMLEKMQAQQERNAPQQAIEQKVEEGIAKGVQAGVTRIATELTSGVLAQRARLPEGPPVHIGTPATNDPKIDLGPGGDAARAQGSRPSPTAQGMGPQTHLVGNQPGPGAIPVQAGTE